MSDSLSALTSKFQFPEWLSADRRDDKLGRRDALVRPGAGARSGVARCCDL